MTNLCHFDSELGANELNAKLVMFQERGSAQDAKKHLVKRKKFIRNYYYYLSFMFPYN